MVKCFFHRDQPSRTLDVVLTAAVRSSRYDADDEFSVSCDWTIIIHLIEKDTAVCSYTTTAIEPWIQSLLSVDFWRKLNRGSTKTKLNGATRSKVNRLNVVFLFKHKSI